MSFKVGAALNQTMIANAKLEASMMIEKKKNVVNTRQNVSNREELAGVLPFFFFRTDVAAEKPD